MAVNFTNLKVTIIGLGLIGGSLARVLRERLGIQDITAVNRSMEAIGQAMKDGSISRGFQELNEYVWSSDIIFICTPVKRTMQYLDALEGKTKSTCIVTDVGSTKGEIIEYVNHMKNPPCFIGGHPMAGAEKTGYQASFAHLFENAYYILCSSKTTTKEAEAIMMELVEKAGGLPVILEAQEHDRITACISHIPHVVAAALVNLVSKNDSQKGMMQMLAAGGFKDITRIASSSPEMWENIIRSNKTQVKNLLELYIEMLKEFIGYMDMDDSQSIHTFFEESKNYRDAFPASKKGLLNPLHVITVDAIDKPGIIGQIAALLGKNNINIKNINVANSRELEQGCLKIALPDEESANISFDLLTATGYKVYKT